MKKAVLLTVATIILWWLLHILALSLWNLSYTPPPPPMPPWVRLALVPVACLLTWWLFPSGQGKEQQTKTTASGKENDPLGGASSQVGGPAPGDAGSGADGDREARARQEGPGAGATETGSRGGDDGEARRGGTV